MNRRALVLALLGAFVLPTLLLAWLGMRALSQESERGAARYRSRAEAVAGALAAQLQASIEELGGGVSLDGALQLRFGVDGSWLGATPQAVEQATASDPALLSSLIAETDRIEAQGERERTLERLVEIEQLSSDPLIVGWALSTRAALADAAGDRSAGDLARRALIERAPTARDAHGLLRAFVARLVLSEGEADPAAARLSLYADASADYRELSESATAEFLRRLRIQLGAQLEPSDARLTAIDRLDASRSQWRCWWGSLRHGITDWVARGAPGANAVFASLAPPILSANPLSMEAAQASQRAGGRSFVAGLRREGDVWVGQALPLALIVDRALTSQLVDGVESAQEFGVYFETKLAPPAVGAPELVASRGLPPPLEEYTIAVRGGDFAAFLAGERRRILFVSLAVALAIVVAALAAWLSLRAVTREVEAARGREEFVAAVTHELKTPLATIRLFAEMLQRGDVEEHKVREFGERTVAQADRLARLVDSVLDLARIEHSAAAQTTLELSAVAADAIEIVERVATQQGFGLRLVDESRSARVRGDGEALVRAVVNLLENALKYSDKPHAIELRLERRGTRQVVITVLDRGRGVPAAEAQRIFEPFRRVGSELTRDRPGVGLGLALVAKIAAAHGGSASCTAREGGGSCFTIELPLAAESSS